MGTGHLDQALCLTLHLILRYRCIFITPGACVNAPIVILILMGGDEVLPEAAYIDAVIRDLEFEQSRIPGRPVISLFIGGGTPSLISTEGLKRLMEALRSRVELLPDAEITLEANPGSAEAGRFCAYREAGVNRLSIGVQSFNNEKLQRIGRTHDGDEALRAIAMAHSAGFDNINIDIMYALPDQNIVEAMRDLHMAIAQCPGHISWYQLTIEPNTEFYKHPPGRAD